MSLFATRPLLPLFALLALPARAQETPVAHRSARLEELCQQMEALAGAADTKENRQTVQNILTDFEKVHGCRAEGATNAERAKACRAWWTDRIRSAVDADTPKAIAAGVALLKSRQQPDGGWKFCTCGGLDRKEVDITLGTTALAVYTLLKCGVPPDDNVVAAGLQHILKLPFDKIAERGTYVNAVIVMALAEAVHVQKTTKGNYKTEARERAFQAAAAPRIAECADWLIKAQIRSGLTLPVLGRWYYTKSPEVWDNSCTQFAILGLLAARNTGFVVPPDTWQVALNHWRVTQIKDGGWCYSIPKGQEAKVGTGTASMTLAGLACTLISKAALKRIDTLKAAEKEKPIDLAKAWLEKNYPVGRPFHKSDNHGNFAAYYTLYALERAMQLAGWEELAGHDWYHEGALHILFDQRPDGSWVDTPDTCFALLFLKRAYVPVMATHGAGVPPPQAPKAGLPAEASAKAGVPAEASAKAGEARPAPKPEAPVAVKAEPPKEAKPEPPVKAEPPPAAPAPKGGDPSADSSAEARRAKAEASPSGAAPPAPPPPEKRGPGDGPASLEEPAEVSAVLGAAPQAKGLVLVQYEDGLFEAATLEGKPCVKMLPCKTIPERHLYFDVADALSWKSQAVDVVIEYFDGAAGQFRVQYDSSDPAATLQGAFKSTERVPLTGTNAWKTTTFRLPDPVFRNRQQGRFDFRIENGGEEMHVHRVAVVRGTPAPKGGEASPSGPAPQGAESSPSGTVPPAAPPADSPTGAKSEAPPPGPPAAQPPPPAKPGQ